MYAINLLPWRSTLFYWQLKRLGVFSFLLSIILIGGCLYAKSWLYQRSQGLILVNRVLQQKIDHYEKSKGADKNLSKTQLRNLQQLQLHQAPLLKMLRCLTSLTKFAPINLRLTELIYQDSLWQLSGAASDLQTVIKFMQQINTAFAATVPLRLLEWQPGNPARFILVNQSYKN